MCILNNLSTSIQHNRNVWNHEYMINYFNWTNLEPDEIRYTTSHSAQIHRYSVITPEHQSYRAFCDNVLRPTRLGRFASDSVCTELWMLWSSYCFSFLFGFNAYCVFEYRTFEFSSLFCSYNLYCRHARLHVSTPKTNAKSLNLTTTTRLLIVCILVPQVFWTYYVVHEAAYCLSMHYAYKLLYYGGANLRLKRF